MIRFSTETRSFATLDDTARMLLKLCGHSAEIPGAIPANAIAEAHAELERNVARLSAEEAQQANTGADEDEDDEQAEPAVGIRQRAFPLLELLQAALDTDSGLTFHRV